jgi:hypothetical protein
MLTMNVQSVSPTTANRERSTISSEANLLSKLAKVAAPFLRNIAVMDKSTTDPQILVSRKELYDSLLENVFKRTDLSPYEAFLTPQKLFLVQVSEALEKFFMKGKDSGDHDLEGPTDEKLKGAVNFCCDFLVQAFRDHRKNHANEWESLKKEMSLLKQDSIVATAWQMAALWVSREDVGARMGDHYKTILGISFPQFVQFCVDYEGLVPDVATFLQQACNSELTKNETFRVGIVVELIRGEVKGLEQSKFFGLHPAAALIAEAALEMVETCTFPGELLEWKWGLKNRVHWAFKCATKNWVPTEHGILLYKDLCSSSFPSHQSKEGVGVDEGGGSEDASACPVNKRARYVN